MSKKNLEDILIELDKILRERRDKMPNNSYVTSLYKKGNNHINEKIIEEANEYIEAVDKKNKKGIIHEAADLWFHNLVSLSLNDISSNDILEELRNRFGLSGLEEKKLRKK
jgi:phosphoribosyl-ATP pyrophosphohydrolase